MIDGICISYSSGYNCERFNKVFNQCVSDEYPRRYSKNYLNDSERFSDEGEIPEDVDETEGTRIMRLIVEEVRKAKGKEDDGTYVAITAHIRDAGFDPDQVAYYVRRYRQGHRIGIPPPEVVM